MFGKEHKIKDLIDNLIFKTNLKEVYYLELIKRNLHQIFPIKNDTEILVENIKNGNLTLYCESSAWREEIKLRKNQIINKTNEILDYNYIKSIEIR